MLFRLQKVLSSTRKITALTSNYSDMPVDFAAPRRSFVFGDREKLLTLGKRFVEATGCDVQLDFVDGQIQLPSTISVFLEGARGFVVSRLRVR